MTNPAPCTPPPGTPEGTWHWLAANDIRRKWYWKRGGWFYGSCVEGNSLLPSFLDRIGWRYIGPVEAESEPRFRGLISSRAHIKVGMSHIKGTYDQSWVSEEPLSDVPVPSPSDALLREALVYVETDALINKEYGYSTDKSADLAARIRHHLGEKT